MNYLRIRCTSIASQVRLMTANQVVSRLPSSLASPIRLSMLFIMNRIAREMSLLARRATRQSIKIITQQQSRWFTCRKHSYIRTWCQQTWKSLQNYYQYHGSFTCQLGSYKSMMLSSYRRVGSMLIVYIIFQRKETQQPMYQYQCLQTYFTIIQTCIHVITISSTYVSLGRQLRTIPRSMLFIVDIRKGIIGRFCLLVFYKKQQQQMLSFKSIANQYSQQQLQVSIYTQPIDVLKFYIYCHLQVGRKLGGIARAIARVVGSSS